MTDDLYDDQDSDESDDQIVLSKKEHDRLAAQARRANKAEENANEAAAAKRELAFLKAGVDTDSKLGKLMLKSYDGDLTVDAIKAEATDLGLLEVAQVKEPEFTPEEMASTDARSDLASGAQADVLNENPDPIGSAIRAGQEHLGRGGKEEEAVGLVFRNLAQNENLWQPSS